MTSPVILDGKYELVEMAGEGGMASVWKAQVKGAAGFSRAVAIKKIKSEYRSIKNYTEMFIEAMIGAVDGDGGLRSNQSDCDHAVAMMRAGSD